MSNLMFSSTPCTVPRDTVTDLMAVEKSGRSVSRQEVLVVLIWRILGTPSILFSYITFLSVGGTGHGWVASSSECGHLSKIENS